MKFSYPHTKFLNRGVRPDFPTVLETKHITRTTHLLTRSTYTWTVACKILENKFPCAGVNPDPFSNGLFRSESLYQLEVLCASCESRYQDLLPIPVGAAAVSCNSTAEALNATKLISCIQMEGVRLTLVAGSPSGVVLDDVQYIHEKKEFYMQPHLLSNPPTQKKTRWPCLN
jgi:hypothetical protein